MKRRHAAVHYRSELDSGDARDAALEAVRFVLPACVLVSLVFRFVPAAGGLDVYDSPDYGAGEPPLTDEQYADPARASPKVEYPY